MYYMLVSGQILLNKKRRCCASVIYNILHCVLSIVFLIFINRPRITKTHHTRSAAKRRRHEIDANTSQISKEPTWVTTTKTHLVIIYIIYVQDLFCNHCYIELEMSWKFVATCEYNQCVYSRNFYYSFPRLFPWPTPYVYLTVYSVSFSLKWVENLLLLVNVFEELLLFISVTVRSLLTLSQLLMFISLQSLLHLAWNELSICCYLRM